MKKVVTAALVAGATMSTAFAADLPSRKAPVYVAPPPLMTWTGFHIGVNAGARFGGSTTATTFGAPVLDNVTFPANVGGGAVIFPNLGAAIASSLTQSVGVGNRTGAILGVQAGYDYQFATSFVVGLEADIQGVIGSGARGTSASGNNIGLTLGGGAPPGNPFPTGSAVVVSKRLDYIGTVRARLGYTIVPSFLIYATGGLAYGGVKSNTVSATIATTQFNAGNFGVTNVAGGQGGFSTNRVGYTIGGGGEWMIAPGWSLKAEYLYYDLGTASYNGGNTFATNTLNSNAFFGGANPAFASTAQRTRLRYDGQIARVGVNYHFWGPPAAAVVARY